MKRAVAAYYLTKDASFLDFKLLHVLVRHEHGLHDTLLLEKIEVKISSR